MHKECVLYAHWTGPKIAFRFLHLSMHVCVYDIVCIHEYHVCLHDSSLQIVQRSK